MVIVEKIYIRNETEDEVQHLLLSCDDCFKQNKKEPLSQNNDDLKKNIIQGDFKDL